RCLGCDTCTVSCKQENGTPADVFFARVLNVESGTFPDVKRVYLPVLCNHCKNPQCVLACPNKAIFKRKDGIVIIDQDRCKGTGACVSACPYGNIFLTENDSWYLENGTAVEEQSKKRLVKNAARKCHYCAHRIEKGLKPACVSGCPATARIFGDLDDPNSEVSLYLIERKKTTNREKFHLLTGSGCDPTTSYLAPISNPETAKLFYEGDESA
ncbi:MAG: 4Fe-4S dicluster domain-containing protein, partial [Candidatus Margulisiibacteriota bacterium]